MKYFTLPVSLAFIFLFTVNFNSFASNPSRPGGSVQATEFMHKNKALFFEENKGQLMDPKVASEKRNVITDVKYYGHSNGVYLYCKPGMLSFVFTKAETDNSISEATGTTEDGLRDSPFPKARPNGLSGRGAGGFDPAKRQTPQPSKISTSRTDLLLVGSNPNAQIIATDQQEYYENFYTGGDADHGITNVHTYKTVTYKSIYPHIDMVLQAPSDQDIRAGKDQGMEYSFIVHPGGKVSDIQLQWDGTESAKSLANGGFKFSNSLGMLEESAPRSFQNGRVVESGFKRNGFTVGRYDKGKDLVIDPSLVWATYFGGNGQDQGTAVTTDNSGNVFITGWTQSKSGIATSGAYQTSFTGGGSSINNTGDAFIAKFNNEGNILWATYYGGSGDDRANGISLDVMANVYIAGYTTSVSGIATSGAFQSSSYDITYGSGGDGFLAKFNATGAIVWATYFGGKDHNGSIIEGIACQNTNGDVYITGSTESYSGLATSGAFQTSINGNSDAFIAKFNLDGKESWATYFGGNGEEGSNGISINDSGNLFITGYTNSSTGLATSGAYQTSYGGGSWDVFLTKFSSDGIIFWSTYFGGNNQDMANGLSLDSTGNVYITGSTSSVNGIASSDAFQTSQGDMFLAKFSSAGIISWSTYFGGNFDASYGICTDRSGNVYISGYTDSKKCIASPGSYQDSLEGLNDAFIAKFSSAGDKTYATYYGGSKYCLAYAVGSDHYGNIYVTGNTNNDSGIANSGVYQTSYGGHGDAFLTKFHDHLSGINPTKNPDKNILNIYPNPFTDKTLINFTLAESSHVKISVMDMKGNVLYIPADKAIASGKNEVEINATEAGLSPGTYFVNVMINDQFISKKIIEVR